MNDKQETIKGLTEAIESLNKHIEELCDDSYISTYSLDAARDDRAKLVEALCQISRWAS